MCWSMSAAVIAWPAESAADRSTGPFAAEEESLFAQLTVATTAQAAAIARRLRRAPAGSNLSER